MDNENDWQEKAIEEFEQVYKLSLPCGKFYPADECGRIFKAWCLNCGWHRSECEAEGARKEEEKRDCDRS